MYSSSQAVISAIILAALANGISVNSPNAYSEWQSGTSSQTVTWTAVSTDPSSFLIQLVNQQGFLPNGPVTLSSSTNTGSPNQQNSATVSYPSGSWPEGHGFQINLMSSDQNNAAILAQSNQFNITSGGSSSNSNSVSVANAVPSSSSGVPPITLTNGAAVQTTGTSQSTLTSLPAGYTGDATGGIPNAVTSTKGAAPSQFGKPGPFIGFLIAAAGVFGVMI
ncbi:hypothetical protein BD324DRAFT_622712 [Kockovaella imperatae]|uniref:Yeast cell wall synthesis Kre9/Knh1-like N-terminal domain-containing protein n=1 Tax=Kockovaella imperatae TaxID=4999 RepID=A0A1Y1UKJ2_9TREE|nr:hypothetical protein BD324DRAFT_622712 [Kockovaella imperatae]ORX37645.1 hypothetical protein BD324DRAFT_622712 [Kockovaella imperatae]